MPGRNVRIRNGIPAGRAGASPRAALTAWLAAVLGLALAGGAARGEDIRPLQPILDAAAPGATVTLEPGTYGGPATLTKPLTIDGGDKAVLDGGRQGTVLTIEANGATVRNLTIRRSGDNHEQLDAGIKIRGKFNIIKDNRFQDCLFGVDLAQSTNNIIRRNDIDSVEADIGQRGEGVRLWYSDDNLIEGNHIHDARDTAIWYSKNNRIIGNRIDNGRYGIHFMYSHYNLVSKNRIVGNTVGIFLMYSNDIEVVDNEIHYSQGPSGIGLGFKETSGAKIVNNDFFANATGIYLDASPYDPDADNLFQGNRIAYNGTSVLFHSDWTGNRFSGNDFIGNHLEVAVNGAGTARRNDWSGNYWDSYEGFDRNRDGTGDTPFEAWAWSDRLWMDLNEAQFFRASPALEALDFVERLAPVTEPRLLFADPRPATGRLTARGAVKAASAAGTLAAQGQKP